MIAQLLVRHVEGAELRREGFARIDLTVGEYSPPPRRRGWGWRFVGKRSERDQYLYARPLVALFLRWWLMREGRWTMHRLGLRLGLLGLRAEGGFYRDVRWRHQTYGLCVRCRQIHATGEPCHVPRPIPFRLRWKARA